MNITLKSIGMTHSSRKEMVDDNWDQEDSFIELNDEFSNEALWGLGDFSHVEVVFFMNKVDPSKIEMSARHPRNNPDWPKVGIFSQRGKNRPNPIGLTICEVLKIDGKKLFLKGLDAIDGTPILDIKPVMKEFLPRSELKQPLWSKDLMNEYWRKK